MELAPFPWPARVGLGAWELAGSLGIGRPDLDESRLVAAARKRTGLHAFGDESFRQPMRRLIHSLEEEAGLHLLGRSVMRSSIVRALECRLRFQQLRDLHGEIDELPVESPVFITGMQRTGTTKLHRLLSCTPGLRHLASVDALNPAPLGRPVRHDPVEWQRRRAFARRAELGMKYLSPALFAIHPIEADSPEEDVFLFDVTFISPAVDASLSVPSYTKWIREIDQRPPYEYFRRLIQLLLWQRPGRYLGKTPHHQENLDVLLEVFPDARIIHTHRDPRKVVPSFSSMMAHTGQLLSSRVDLHAVGRRVADQMANSVERAIVAREHAPAGSVLDVHYVDLMRDATGEMRRIHEFLGIEWAAGSKARVERWVDSNPQHKYGTHRYGLADFGLDPEELDARFKRYREHFGVAREGA
ncbi:MAG: sulfotransferase [Spirochaetaceae bacterium]|nr:sulfotransferase [Spirochaetaceae bacterium]